MASDNIKKIDKLIEVIVRSIPKEREVQQLYRQTAAEAPNEMTRLLFERLADQEAVHEKKLRAVLELLKAEREEGSG